MRILQLFGQNNIELGSEICDADYRVIPVHPECNSIFFVGEERTLIAYDMDRRKVHVIHVRVIRYARPSGHLDVNGPYYLSYVPLYLESIISRAVKLHLLYLFITTCLCVGVGLNQSCLIGPMLFNCL